MRRKGQKKQSIVFMHSFVILVSASLSWRIVEMVFICFIKSIARITTRTKKRFKKCCRFWICIFQMRFVRLIKVYLMQLVSQSYMEPQHAKAIAANNDHTERAKYYVRQEF